MRYRLISISAFIIGMILLLSSGLHLTGAFMGPFLSNGDICSIAGMGLIFFSIFAFVKSGIPPKKKIKK